jgi:hypothetical protein
MNRAVKAIVILEELDDLKNKNYQLHILYPGYIRSYNPYAPTAVTLRLDAAASG